MNSKITISKYDEYIKCYNDNYIKSCKIAKDIDDSNGINTCDNLEWDTNTRINVGFYCRNKIYLNLEYMKTMNNSK